MSEAARGTWAGLHPRAARALLAGLGAPWWVAGGWALDLFLGRQTRPHKDLDVGILRRDAPQVPAALAGWEFFAAHRGRLARCDPGHAPQHVHGLWVRPAPDSPWTLELLLDESAGDRWLFRRDPHIARPLREIVRRDPEGIPYLAPEVQLLYKAQRPRDEDAADFAQVLPHLEPDARDWLLAALTRSDPAHAWLARLRGC
jgi:hypothetical protein